ncbi:hypothetical protein AAW14_11895 [Streptomyces hygroscopicus]|nr:hypothetical protein [Streptomyces hygroscopicus]
MFAAVCVLLAALGHVMMSGSSVPWWALAVGALATGGAGWCLAGRERGLPLVVSVVVTAQAALHSAFSYAQSGHASMASMNPMNPMKNLMEPMHSMHAMDAMDMGGAHMGSGAMASMDMSHMAGMGSIHTTGPSVSAGSAGSSIGMLAAHLLAALLCGLWLAYGERAVFRILRAVAGWLAAPLRLLLALPAPPDRPRIRARRRADRSPRRLLLVHPITSRGPPLGTAVV